MRETYNRGNAVLIAIIIIVIVVAGVWYYVAKHGTGKALETPATVTQNANPQTPTKAAPDTSDASIEADLGAADKSVTALTADTQSIDQSMNDKPISQDY